MRAIDGTFELLCGYRDKTGTLHKDFEINEMDGSVEEAISRKEIKQNGGKVIRTILEMCCTRIGTLKKADMKDTQWREIIQGLQVADQDYMVFKIREFSIGEELTLKHTCPNCDKSLETLMTVNELEITPFDGLETFDFVLPKGYADKKGTMYTKGKLRHPNGLDREILDPIARNNLGYANTLMLVRCITDFGIQVTDAVMRDIPYSDRTYLLQVMKEHQFGYNLEVEILCDNCGSSFKALLNVVNFL
jgi:hypothetical protein